MTEILWKSNKPHVPLQDHEMVELRLVDLGDTATPRFLVREIHAAWSAADQQIQWKNYEDDPCATGKEAQHRFESRKANLVDAGFPYATILN